VLHDVALQLKAGEMLGLLGPNGSGKSTLLRALSGVLPLSSGAIMVNGADISRLKRREVARAIGFVPQQEGALFDFTVGDVVLMGRYAHSGQSRGPTEADFAAAAAAMQRADIVGLAARTIGTLSGGEHRRVLLARALAQETPILLLDEPTAHLDPGHQVDLLALVRDLTRNLGIGAVIALHDVDQAGIYCDRVVLLRDGRVRAQGATAGTLTPETLLAIFDTQFEAVVSPLTGTRHLIPVARPKLSHEETSE
jgi:iron complex transport system ATP-binding protein